MLTKKADISEIRFKPIKNSTREANKIMEFT